MFNNSVYLQICFMYSIIVLKPNNSICLGRIYELLCFPTHCVFQRHHQSVWWNFHPAPHSTEPFNSVAKYIKRTACFRSTNKHIIVSSLYDLLFMFIRRPLFLFRLGAQSGLFPTHILLSCFTTGIFVEQNYLNVTKTNDAVLKLQPPGSIILIYKSFVGGTIQFQTHFQLFLLF